MKLFVGNLPYDLTDETLKKVFEKAGDVTSAKIIFDRYTNRSKGFGFVEMSSKEAGEKAVKELNGKEVNGRAIAVKEAIEKEQRERGGDRGGFGGGERSDRGGERRGSGDRSRGERTR